MANRAWIALTFGDKRSYAGNTGYEDDISRIYRYDSNVPNHLRVSRGDLIFLRDQRCLLGFGSIAEIRVTEATKTILRCPICGTSQIYSRPGLDPAFYCREHKAITEPIQEVVTVQQYEADYSATYIAVPPTVSAGDLQSAYIRYNRQLSIQELDRHGIVRLFRSRPPDAIQSLVLLLQTLTISPEEGIDQDPVFDPQNEDARAKYFGRSRSGEASVYFEIDFSDAMMVAALSQAVVSSPSWKPPTYVPIEGPAIITSTTDYCSAPISTLFST